MIKNTYEKCFLNENLQEFIASRRPYIYYEASYDGKFNTKLDNITLKMVSEDNSTTAYDYSASIKLIYNDGNTESVIETCQVVLKKENNVGKYWSTKYMKIHF